MYRSKYLYTHDIDWFCRFGEIPVHIASNGGLLPSRSYRISQLVSLQHKIANMDQVFRCEINTEHLNRYLVEGEYYTDLNNLSEEEFRMLLPAHFEVPQEARELSRPVLAYSWSFIEMAKRGFLSFDRYDDEERGNLYHLIAWPTNFDLDQFNVDVFNSLKSYEIPFFYRYNGSLIYRDPLNSFKEMEYWRLF